ncbi:MAG: histidinol-phosphatase [Gammaproteobacteria bacterium]|nr:histidinol-phosphatase [Gammaproteobacteria bacterium]MCY4276140.1 histidinol-phosphatase [Gammaproteobacteria bacterium]
MQLSTDNKSSTALTADSLFDHGSCWLQSDFHLHTRADKEFNYQGKDNDYLNQYVNALRTAEIRIGIIANHNKFDLSEFKELRKKARKSSIGLLPGIELSINDGRAGVHTLVVFSDEWINGQTNYIDAFLNSTFAGKANYQNENARSNHNIVATVQELDKFDKDYFFIFAHVESNNGLWGGLSPGRVKDLFDNASVRRRVLAFQKVRTRDTQNKICQILGPLYPAEVEGCDPKKLDDILTRKCTSFLKLGNFSFEAVKFALLDHTFRVRKELPEYSHSYIRKVSFEGTGSLGGTEICLSPELNTLIGIRGGGKSSVLEGIRYALDIQLGDKSIDSDYKESLVKHLLQSGGKITIDAIDRRNQHYQIRRILGHRPDVYVNGQLQPGVSIRETILYQPIYFGQNDLSCRGEGFEKDLIEKLIGEALTSIRQNIQQAQKRVIDAIGQIKQLERASFEHEEWEEKKKDAEFKMNFYRQHGIESKLKKQVDFDKDERKVVQVIRQAKSYLTELDNFIVTFEDELNNQTSYKSDQNQSFFNDFFSTYQHLLDSFDEIKKISVISKETVSNLEQKLDSFQHQKSRLKEEFAQIERNIVGEIKQANTGAISLEEFKQVKSVLDQSEQMLALLAKRQEKYSDFYSNLEVELSHLEGLWLEEYRTIENVLDKVNQVNSPLKIEPKFMANKDAMLNHIKGLFRGSNIREAKLQQLVNNYKDFGSVWKNKDRLQQSFDGAFENFWQHFENNLEELLTWQVPNDFKIRYHGETISHHSLGQRASALMLFILSQKENDVVIVDQPEDDLDNQTIYNDIILLIRQLKPNTQFVFATHNANIPVLGDADQVIACKYQDNHVGIFSGSIDGSGIQQCIVDIMEGGKVAFKKRKDIYKTWKPRSF